MSLSAPSCVRRFAPRSLAAGLALALLSAAADPAPAASPSAAELDRRLLGLTPAYPASLAAAVEMQEDAPVRLLGVDLLQAGKPAADARVSGQHPLTVVCYWSPRSTLTAPVPVEFRIASFGGRLSNARESVVGVPRAPAPWRPGSVYKQSYDLDTAVIARNFSGNVSLVVSLLSRHRGNFRPVPLQRLPLYLSPNPGPGKVKAPSLKEAFGPNAVSLSSSFRLGSGAEHTIILPPNAPAGSRRVGVVSAFSYGSVRQGEAVCEVTATTVDGQSHTWTLRSGEATARTDYDFNPPAMGHRKVKAVESWDADYLNVDDRPFKKQNYATVLDVPPGLAPLKSLAFRSRNPFIFEVFDVALVP